MTSQGGDLPDWQTRVKLQADQLLQTHAFPAGLSTAPMLDVSEFNSLLISDQNPGGHAGSVTINISWFDINGIEWVSDEISLAAVGGVQNANALALPVRAPQCQVSNDPGSAAVTLAVYGSGRTETGALAVGYQDIISYSLASAAYVAGQIVTINTPFAQGLCQVEFVCTGGTLSGDLNLQFVDGNAVAQNMRLIYANQQVVSGSAKIFCGQVIFPASAAIMQFVCRVAGTGAVSVNVIALGH